VAALQPARTSTRGRPRGGEAMCAGVTRHGQGGRDAPLRRGQQRGGGGDECRHFLASPPRVDTGSTISSGARNARELAFPSTATRTQRILTTAPRNANPIGLYIYRCYPQAHGFIVVAFHLEIFRVSLFIFSQRKTIVTNILT
jgi:hypothetical protein